MLAWLLNHPVACGLFLSLGIGTVVITPAFYLFCRNCLKKKPDTTQLVLAGMVGFVERLIYFVGALLTQYEMIAGWLLLKSIATFSGNRVESDVAYQLYLLGNGLSIFFGIGGAYLTHWIRMNHAELVARFL